VHIEAKASRENLPDILSSIGQACHRYHIPKQTRLDLQLAVEEACVNIIEHGYADLQPGMIEIDFQREEDRIFVAITDFGHEFDPSTYRRRCAFPLDQPRKSTGDLVPAPGPRCESGKRVGTAAAAYIGLEAEAVVAHIRRDLGSFVADAPRRMIFH